MLASLSRSERKEEHRRLLLAEAWISQGLSPPTLEEIEEACRLFDLSPLEEDSLIKEFIKKEG